MTAEPATTSAVVQPATTPHPADEAPEPASSARQWLSLIAQVIVALAVGALLFYGFERLWDQLPWVALALAVLVILVLAAVSRALRRSDDTLGVVIAIVAGLIVTMGPLALVLSQR
jgi:hypothetical protein